MTIAAILLAGGLSTRMGPHQEKVFTFHHGKPLALYALEPLLHHPLITHITVVCPPHQCHHFPPSSTFALPGTERHLSLGNALQTLPPHTEWVVVHDAARPLLCPNDLNRLLALIDCADGAALAAPVQNTLVKGDDAKAIVHPIDRTHLWETYTPQLARYADLLAALEIAQKKDFHPTDEMSLLHLLELKPHLLQVTFPSPKLTYSCDLPLIYALLNQLHSLPNE